MPMVLEKLFGSAPRIKLIRLFLLNKERAFPPREIGWRAQIGAITLRKELALLRQIGLIKSSTVTMERVSRNAGRKAKKKKIHGFTLNQKFAFLVPLRNLVLNAAPVSRATLLKRLKSTGNLKLITLAGIFIQEETRLDLLVVGDRMKKGIFEKVLRGVEAEVGKELAYACLTTQEFKYRLGMYDRFIRDVLDYPHEHVLNKLNL